MGDLDLVPPTECKIEPAQSFFSVYCLVDAMPWADIVPLWEPKIVLDFNFANPFSQQIADLKQISIQGLISKMVVMCHKILVLLLVQLWRQAFDWFKFFCGH